MLTLRFLFPAALAAALGAALAAQEQRPEGFAEPDHEIEIGVRPGLLRFAVERFTVAPGSKVELTLVNNDAMQHNLLICRPGDGVTRKVGTLALQLGAEASAKEFVPDSPDVLFHTRAILPGQRDTIWFEAPAEPGEYPYVCTLPGHMFTMVGVMQVGEVAQSDSADATALRALHYRAYDARFQKLPDFGELGEPALVGELPEGLIDLAPLKRSRDYAVVFEAALQVPAAGRYTFALNSDDGSRVRIDGNLVVEWDGTHPGGKPRTGAVELSEGSHDLRLEFFQAGGGQLLQLAWEGPDLPRQALSVAPPRRGAPPPAIPIMVHHAPRMLRVHVEGAAARSISVGLPGGTNYCFDAERCAVQFGWSGAFLDVGPDRLGRGGKPCKTLGPRFSVGDIGFPLRTRDGRKLPVHYIGYRLGDEPEFLIDWGGKWLSWKIGADPDGAVGLRYTFRFDGIVDGGLQFAFDPAKARCSTGSGAAGAAGRLDFLDIHTREFSVTLTPLQEVGK